MGNHSYRGADKKFVQNFERFFSLCCDVSSGERRTKASPFGWWLILILLFGLSSHAVAQTFLFDVSQQSADGALTELADQADITVVFDYDLVSQYQSNSLAGVYSISEAVELILEGIPLKHEFGGGDHLVITSDNNPGENTTMVNSSNRRILGAVLGFLAGTTGVSSVTAQDAGGPALVLEEILVTARKREESLQDVPVAISVITDTAIAEAGIDELGDVLNMSPGMVYNERDGNRQTALPGVRGIKTFTDPGAGVQRVSSFVNGMPVAGSQATIQFVDVENVEVYRGPQSAVFGRSVYAGAVNYNLRQASLNEADGNISAQFGENGRQGLSAWGTTSIIEDVLGIYGSFSTDSWDGPNGLVSTNQFDPTEQVKMGSRETDYYSVALAFEPTDTLSMSLRYSNTELDDGPAADYNLDPATDPNLIQEQPGYAGIYVGELQFDDSPVLRRNFCAWDGDCITDPGWELERDRLEFDVDAGFGGGNLALKVFHSEDTVFTVDDQDNTDRDPLAPPHPANGMGAVNMGNDTAIEEDYAEVIWTSPDDARLRYTLGYSNYSYDSSSVAQWPHPTSDTIDGDGGAPSGSSLSIKNTGFFGGLFYDVTDHLTLSVEARQQTDKIEGTSATIETDSFLPRFAANYALTDNVNVYAQFSKGVQPAAINAGTQGQAQIDAAAALDAIGATTGASALLQDLAIVPEEELTNFEIGFKGTFLDGRAQLNGAIFNIDVEGYTESLNMFFWPIDQDLFTIQADLDTYACANGIATLCGAVGDTTARVRGPVVVGDLESNGLELGGAYLLSENVTLEGAFTYLNTKFGDACNPGYSIDSYNLDDDVLTLAGGGELGCVNISGNTFPYAPKVQFNLAATYEGSLSANWDYFTRVGARHESKQFMDHRELGWIPSSTLWDLRAGVSNDTTRVELYVTNLTDDRTPLGAQYEPDRDEIARNFVGPLCRPGCMTGPNIVVAPGREAGVRLSYSF